jgi:uncharacterized membrane protein
MRKYLITGLLIWVPLAITVWVLHLIIGSMDSILLLLPPELRPDVMLLHALQQEFAVFRHVERIPGVGVVFTLVVLLVTGVLAANIIGRRLVRYGENLLGRIPVFKSIYYSVKQVSDTLFSDSGQAFRKALLVRFPHGDSWTVAFQTGVPAPELAAQLPEPYVSVYVPTTPNPTSGYFIMVPQREVRELDMSVDAALKYVVSMGVVAPPTKPATM